MSVACRDHGPPGVVLMAAVRSLVPQVAATGNRAWFPALVGVYATTFAYD